MSMILFIIEEAEYNYGNLEKIINKEIEECLSRIKKIESMSYDEFMKMISGYLFGIASKDYYIRVAKKRIEELKGIKETIDNLLEYLNDKSFPYLDLTLNLKYYKGYKRSLKKALFRLNESKLGKGLNKTLASTYNRKRVKE